MSTYPLRLYRAPGPDSIVVNTGDEEDAAHENGYRPDPPAKQEYPKMLYLHPVDKTQEHRIFVVNNAYEQENAMAEGFKTQPHIPVVPADEEFEQGSGSEKYGASDWTAAGRRADGSPVEKGSPEDVS